MKNSRFHALLYSIFLLFTVSFIMFYIVVGEEYKLKLGRRGIIGNGEEVGVQVYKAKNEDSAVGSEKDRKEDIAGVQVIARKGVGLIDSIMSFAEKKEKEKTGLKAAVLSAIDNRTTSESNSETQEVTISGTLTIVHGDPVGVDAEELNIPMLKKDSGGVLFLDISDEKLEQIGNIETLSGTKVSVKGVTGSFTASTRSMNVTSISTVGTSGSLNDYPVVEGNKPWIILPCKFADKPVEPTPMEYFQLIIDDEFPHLGAYWYEASYHKITTTGSSVAPKWYTLPHPRDYYFYGSQKQFYNPYLVYEDCSQVADPDIYFPDYYGIHIMVNYDTGNYSYYSSGTGDFDGVHKLYHVTFTDPYAYNNLATIAHEMGHSFGMYHSYGGSANIGYGSKWDVMSNGRLVHPLAYHKYRVGWIPDEKIYVPPMNSVQKITLERLAQPPGEEGNYLLAILPTIDDPLLPYTIELRASVGYDSLGLPGEGIIIHRLSSSFYNIYSLRVVDGDDDGDANDEGAIWTAGEVFEDPVNKISVRVLGESGPPPCRGCEGDLENMEVEIIRGSMADLSVNIANKNDRALVSSSVIQQVRVGNLGPDNASNVTVVSEFPNFVEIESKPNFCIERSESDKKYVECAMNSLLGPQTLEDVASTTEQMHQESFDPNIDVHKDGVINALDYGSVLSAYQAAQGSIGLIPITGEIGNVISSGQQEYYDIQFRSDQEGVVTHTVSITGGEIDPDTTNNTYEATTEFVDISNLVPTITSPKDGENIKLGDDILITIEPMIGITEYEVKLYQDSGLINVTNYTSYGPEFSFTPRDEEYSLLHTGSLVVRARVRIHDQWSQEKVITLKLVEYTLNPLIWVQPEKKGSLINIYGCYVFKVQPLLVEADYLFQIYQHGVLKFDNWRDTGNLSSDGTQYVLFNTTDYTEGTIEIHAKALVNNEWTQDSIMYASLSSNTPPSCR